MKMPKLPKMSKTDRKRSETLTQMSRDASDNADPATVREAVNELNTIREKYGMVTRED